MGNPQEERFSTLKIKFDLEAICAPETGICDIQLPLTAGKLVYKNKEAKFDFFLATYDQHLDVILKFSIDGLPLQINSSEIDLKIKIHNSPNALDVLFMKKNVQGSGCTTVTATPKRAPYIIEFNENATKARAYFVNGPKTFYSPLNLTFESPELNLTLHEAENSKTFFDNKKLHKHDYLITYFVEIESKTGESFSFDTAFTELGHLSKLLTFTRGGYVGVGHISGTNRHNECCFLGIGFSRCDQFSLTAEWFGLSTVKRLPEIYTLYRRAISNKSDKAVIARTMEFYRAASVARTYSTETAIITSYAGLETIIPHVLSKYGGWSQTLLNNKIPFHEKLRAAATVIGLMVEPLNQSEHLKKRTKDFNYADAYEILSIFRNRIVHQGKPFKYSGHDIHEAWLLSQWLCELFLFFLFDYRGPIYESRQLRGFKGPEIQVPLR